MTNPNKDREALKKHIRDNHTSVYLTLVSVIVALALGDLFSQVREIYVTAGIEATSALLWLQIVGAFGAAFGVWVGYCHIFITTRWILGIWDALSVSVFTILPGGSSCLSICAGQGLSQIPSTMRCRPHTACRFFTSYFSAV